MRKYAIWKRTEKTLRGIGGEGEFDDYKEESSIMIVPPEKAKDFAEFQAEEFGSQDYSWQVNFKKIGEFDKWELKQIKSELRKIGRLV